MITRRSKFLRKKLDDDNLLIDKHFEKRLKQQLFGGNIEMAKQVKQLTFKELMNHKRFMYAGGALLLVIAATSFYALDNRSQNLASQNVIEDTVELPQNLSDVLSIDSMRNLAANDVPEGASVSSVEIENEHGAVLYKVKFSDGSFRLYDAVTGLPYVETESEMETSESVPADFVPGITLQQARDTAATQRPGKTITKIELEMEEGKVVYSVRFSDGGRVDVNAADGSVVRVRDADNEDTSDDSNDDSDDGSSDDSNEDSDDHKDSEDHEEEDTEDDGDRSGSDSDSGSSNSGSSNDDSNDDSDDSDEDELEKDDEDEDKEDESDDN